MGDVGDELATHSIGSAQLGVESGGGALMLVTDGLELGAQVSQVCLQGSNVGAEAMDSSSAAG
jgi:hypothetical protein